MMDELTAARVRAALRELEDLDPAMVEEFLDHPTWGPLLREALAGRRRRWCCPLCGTYVVAPEAPTGWRILSPFDRVASCDRCTPVFKIIDFDGKGRMRGLKPRMADLGRLP